MAETITGDPVQPDIRKQRWIVCQIGAREHYVLAAEMHHRGQLAALCTDVWAGERSFWKIAANLAGGAAWGRKLLERYEPALRGARVFSQSPFNLATQTIADFAGGRRYWDRIMLANRQFASGMARRLERSGLLRGDDGAKPVVFAYSYAALEILRTAKQAGCLAVLGQIDPGLEEDALVARLAEHQEHNGKATRRPPARYWDGWRQECALADVVIVNSAWSASLLVKAGIPGHKIKIVPLAYSNDRRAEDRPRRSYPDSFSADRPLNVLFLGQVNRRKGVLELVRAMRRLESEPVRLLMAGPVEPDLQGHLVVPPNTTLMGPVSRGSVDDYYRRADIFILPTHSDGFAITQLEALARGLPVIASRHCGEVVIEGHNGRVMHTVTAGAIEQQLRWALKHPHVLAEMAAFAPARLSTFAPKQVVDALLAAVSDAGR